MYKQGDFVYCHTNPSTMIHCPHIVEITNIEDKFHIIGKAVSSTTKHFDNLLRCQKILNWTYGYNIPNVYLRKLFFTDILNQEEILPGYAEKSLNYLLKE